MTVEVAAAEEGRAQRFEVSVTDAIHPRNGVATGFGSKSIGFDKGVPALTADRSQVGRRGAAHARNGTQVVQHFVKARRAALLGVVGVAEVDVHQENMIGVKAGVRSEERR